MYHTVRRYVRNYVTENGSKKTNASLSGSSQMLQRNNFCFRKKEHRKAEVWSSRICTGHGKCQKCRPPAGINIKTNHSLPKNKLDHSFDAKEQKCQVYGVEVRIYLPERSRDTVGPGNVRRLQKSGSPSPLADNNRGSQTGLDHSTSGAVRKVREGSRED